MNPLLLNAKKRILLWGISLVMFLGSALFSFAEAADVSSREILGFSPDGAYFAFEEYGVQDGSGFPYSNIFIINTATNSWVKGSPYRVLLKDETKELAEARDKSEEMALPQLEEHKISVPGLLLAHNPVTELGQPHDKVKVAPGPAPFLKKYALTFKVEAIPLPIKRCADYGDEAQMGFRLTYERTGETPKELHKDKRIPTSRRCPKRYTISDVIRFETEVKAEKALYVVLLQVFSYGFEGDDGRYLATSYWLPSFNATN